jgi:hypothetical protein
MPTRVGLDVGTFSYQRHLPLGSDELGTVLVGHVVKGTVARGMRVLIGSHALTILGVENYGGSSLTFGVLVLTVELEDAYLKEGEEFEIRQSVPIAKSPEETTFQDTFGPLLATALDKLP